MATEEPIASAPVKRFTWLATLPSGGKLDGYVDAASETAARAILTTIADLEDARIEIPNPYLE